MGTQFQYQSIKEKKKNNRAELIINNNMVEQVDNFKYFGIIIIENMVNENELLSRIEYARRTFIKLKKLLTARSLSWP